MSMSQEPKWLGYLSRRLRWIAIPQLAVGFVALQMIGYLLVAAQPLFAEQLMLIPSSVFSGEVWRLVTFLMVPLSMGLIGFLFTLFFGYFILNSIENVWGSFKTTFYVLSSIVLTIIFSLVFGYPITTISRFVSTWFLAAATLFPEQPIQIYFFIPVKMKYLGWIAAAFILLEFLRGTWMDRFYILTIFTNYFLFFGPIVLDRWRQWQRRRKYRSQWK
jgi:hypothetical protein